MMGIEDFITGVCVQTAVYWSKPTSDGIDYVFPDPVEIKCRWEDKKVLFRTTDGKEQVSRAVVYILQDVDEEGYLYLGELTDLDSDEEDDPRLADGAFSIKQFNKSPALGSTSEFIRNIYL